MARLDRRRQANARRLRTAPLALTMATNLLATTATGAGAAQGRRQFYDTKLATGASSNTWSGGYMADAS